MRESGTDAVRLPRGDPRPLTPLEADRLEKTLVVLRAGEEGEVFAQGLISGIESAYKGVLVTNSQLSEPGTGKENAG